jgi:hypothetical protein
MYCYEGMFTAPLPSNICLLFLGADHTENTSTVLLTACVCWTVNRAVAWQRVDQICYNIRKRLLSESVLPSLEIMNSEDEGERLGTGAIAWRFIFQNEGVFYDCFYIPCFLYWFRFRPHSFFFPRFFRPLLLTYYLSACLATYLPSLYLSVFISYVFRCLFFLVVFWSASCREFFSLKAFHCIISRKNSSREWHKSPKL